MKLVFNRVSRAAVTADGAPAGAIGPGALLLLGVCAGDTAAEADLLADKAARLRVFSDAQDKLNLSVLDTGGALLVVSNFTLCARAPAGLFRRRPARHGRTAVPAFCGAAAAGRRAAGGNRCLRRRYDHRDVGGRPDHSVAGHRRTDEKIKKQRESSLPREAASFFCDSPVTRPAAAAGSSPRTRRPPPRRSPARYRRLWQRPAWATPGSTRCTARPRRRVGSSSACCRPPRRWTGP